MVIKNDLVISVIYCIFSAHCFAAASWRGFWLCPSWQLEAALHWRLDSSTGVPTPTPTPPWEVMANAVVQNQFSAWSTTVSGKSWKPINIVDHVDHLNLIFVPPSSAVEVLESMTLVRLSVCLSIWVLPRWKLPCVPLGWYRAMLCTIDLSLCTKIRGTFLWRALWKIDH